MGFKTLFWVDFHGRNNFIDQVYRAGMRAGLDPEPALLLTAQAAHETRWGQRCMNYNLAGVKANEWWRAHRDFTRVGTSECVPCQEGEASSPECPEGERLQHVEGEAFRAFSTLLDGVKGVLELLGDKRYEKSKALLLAGDTAFYRQLGADGWYTASPDVYERASLDRLEVVRAVSSAWAWQRALLRWDAQSLPKYGADGSWGLECDAALKRFQRSMGLAVTGERGAPEAVLLQVGFD